MIVKCTKGFTLAEVLITLAVVGVVSAITLPILTKNYTKHVTENRVKVAYSALNQAMKLSETQNDDFSQWDFNLNTSDFVNTYIKPYYKELRLIDNHNIISSDKTKEKAYICSNGVIISFYHNQGTEFSLAIGIDVNGLSQPNNIGTDQFIFSVDRKMNILPYGWNGAGTTRDVYLTRCTNEDRFYCTALFYIDGFKFKNDYAF